MFAKYLWEIPFPKSLAPDFTKTKQWRMPEHPAFQNPGLFHSPPSMVSPPIYFTLLPPLKVTIQQGGKAALRTYLRVWPAGEPLPPFLLSTHTIDIWARPPHRCCLPNGFLFVCTQINEAGSRLHLHYPHCNSGIPSSQCKSTAGKVAPQHSFCLPSLSVLSPVGGVWPCQDARVCWSCAF
jgi:hypothetical protein